MFKAIWESVLRVIGLSRQVKPSASKASLAPRVSGSTVNVPSSVPARAPDAEPSSTQNKPAPQPAPTRRLHADKVLSISEADVALAKKMLFYVKDGRTIGPTPSQLRVVLTELAAVSVLAGAGSGKSTTLVSRILFLHKVMKKPLENITVFTFTRRSRFDFIERLLAEAERWGVSLTRRKAERIVRTFHSKALEIGRSLVPGGQQFFEFLGEQPKVVPAQKQDPVGAAEDDEEELTQTEQQANGLDGVLALETNDMQSELLHGVYSRCFNSDPQFRKALSNLLWYTLLSQRLAPSEEYNRTLTFLDGVVRRDPALCDYLEEQWRQLGAWPMTGVRERNADGQRYELIVQGKTLHANGFVESLSLYIVLGGFEGIPFTDVQMGRSRLKPGYAVTDKKLLLLTGSSKAIRFVASSLDAERLKIQLLAATTPGSLAAPAIKLKVPGESSPKPAFAALYALGLFAENLGLDPSLLDTADGGEALPAPERAAAYATSAFFREFQKTLADSGLMTFNQLFSMLRRGSPDLKRVSISSLMSVKHLLIDEFQDISPLMVKFVRGLHEELWRQTDGEQEPSLMCVGDDWQSIYGWRGSSPHFLLSFAQTFPGASPTPMLMQENFRSSQSIIDCGESFINMVKTKSKKKGIASNPSVKALPIKTVSIAKYDVASVTKTLRQLLQSTAPDEKVYLLSARNADLEGYSSLSHGALTKTSFHQSKGLEAEYVVLLGAPKSFGTYRIKNWLYRLAEFPATFDEAQADEAFRVAYVAATRAKKMCIWYANPDKSSVIDLVPADGNTRVDLKTSEVAAHIASMNPRQKGPEPPTRR